MTLYVDSSALIKRYVDEADSDLADEILLSDPEWVTAQVTHVEVRLALHRRLDRDRAQDRDPGIRARLAADVRGRARRRRLQRAAELGVATGARSLDALHLAAAERARRADTTDGDIRRQARLAARSLGFAVLGA